MKRIPVTLAGLLALGVCLALILFEPLFLSTASNQLSDGFLRASSVPPRSGVVTIVDIDDASLAHYGQWPWSRRLIARLTRTLHQAGASVVVYDVMFSERDRTSPAAVQKGWRSEFGPGVRIEGIPEGGLDYDGEFASAVAAGPVVLGCFVQIARNGEAVDSSWDDPAYRGRFFERGTPRHDLLPQAVSAVIPLPALYKASAGVAFINTTPDGDNMIRWTPLVFEQGGRRTYPSLSLEAVRVYLGATSCGISWDDEGVRGAKEIRVGKLSIPVDAHGRLSLNFRSSAFPRIPATDVLGGRDITAAVSNRIVFVGSSAAGLNDLVATPMSPEVPGVEVHATAVDNMLAGDALLQPRWAFFAKLGVTLAIGLILVPVIARARAAVSFGAAAAAMALVFVVCWELLVRAGVMIGAGETALSIALIYTLMTLLNYWREEWERKRVRELFGTMVSGDVLRFIENHPGTFSLTGEKVEATVFFSDVANFTSIAEKLDPDVLSRLMNRYLTPMADIIMKRGGYVDKFNGDAVMAVWGAPFPMADHAAQACLAALEQAERLAGLREELAAEFGAEIRVRMGINTGIVTAGNMGSERRFQYTVLGDPVNQAARFQTANKRYGTKIIIGESCFLAAANEIEARCIDVVKVKGKSLPVKIYELLGRKGELPAPLMEAMALYTEGLELHWKGKFDEAIAKLEQVIRLKPDDGPALVLLDHCKFLRESPANPAEHAAEGFDS